MNFPFMTGRKTKTAENNLPLLKEYAWDFEHDCFIKRDGKFVIVTGKEALKVWIYKTLKTERYRYLAYDNAYGIELEQFIGKAPNDDESAMEVKRYVEAALLVNPYIKDLQTVVFTNEKDILQMEVTINSVYGEVIQNV